MAKERYIMENIDLGDSFTADEIEEIRQAMNADENEYVDFEL